VESRLDLEQGPSEVCSSLHLEEYQEEDELFSRKHVVGNVALLPRKES
jgi:hypothetical protein